MNLSREDYGELISLALNTRAGWIPAGPVDAAKRRKLHLYNRANVIARLIQAGLVSATCSKSGQTYTLRLTDDGKQAILVMPDELPGEVWFPLARDIAMAKARVQGLQAKKPGLG